MAENKRYYWIKLKTGFFDIDEIDWLISQANGCEYIVLYQKLCLMTANKGGEMSTTVGEMIVPYDAKKIARDTKFPIDTVVVALELFKNLGLIYEQENGILKIPGVDEMVGSETDYALKKRNQRERKRLQSGDTTGDIEGDNVRQEIEYRDKSIEIRDYNSEKENYTGAGGVRAREEIARLWLKFFEVTPTEFEIDEVLFCMTGRYLAAGEEFRCSDDDIFLLEKAFETAAKGADRPLAYINGVYRKYRERKIYTEDDYWNFEVDREMKAGRV